MQNFDYLDSSLGYWLNERRPADVSRFCNDTRNLQPGECFLAIRTDRRDGNEFLKTAKERGAACAFVNYPQPGIDIPQFICQDTLHTMRKFAQVIRQNFQYPVVAVTGSMGKTSTKDLLGLLLNVENNKTSFNENNVLGILMTMARLRQSEHRAIIEIGIDEFGHMSERLSIVQPTDAIITGVCGIHVGSLGNEENIAREKCRAAEYVVQKRGICVFPEELLRFGCFESLEDTCIVPSTDTSKNVHFLVDQSGPQRMVMIFINGTRYHLPVPHNMSDGMIKNLILSVTYSLLSGVSVDDLCGRLARWQPSYIRGSVIKKDKRVFYADCYNANPDAFKDSLKNFDRLFPCNSRLFIIGSLDKDAIGEMYEVENYKLGAELSLRPGDYVVIVGKQAEIVKRGLDSQKYPFEYTISLNPNDLADKVKNFSGVVYLKGHHSYHLESLIV